MFDNIVKRFKELTKYYCSKGNIDKNKEKH